MGTYWFKVHRIIPMYQTRADLIRCRLITRIKIWVCLNIRQEISDHARRKRS
jgi:hypothetical protein